MEDPVYRTADGRPYTVRDGVSVWREGPSAHPADGYEYVGFGRRLGAKVIDTLLTYLLAFIVGIVVLFVGSFFAGLAGGTAQPLIDNIAQTSTIGWVLSALAVVVFEVAAEAIHGSTPGKMLLGITVLSTDGSYCGFTQALKRALAFYVDSLVFGLPALSSMRSSSRQQRIGDRWAGTVVVRARSMNVRQRRSTPRFLAATSAACIGYAFMAGLSILA